MTHMGMHICNIKLPRYTFQIQTHMNGNLGLENKNKGHITKTNALHAMCKMYHRCMHKNFTHVYSLAFIAFIRVSCMPEKKTRLYNSSKDSASFHARAARELCRERSVYFRGNR